MESTKSVTFKIPTDQWKALRHRLLDRGLSFTTWAKGVIDAELGASSNGKMSASQPEDAGSSPAASTNRLNGGFPPRPKESAMKIIKNADEADALEIDPRIAKAGEMFIDAVRNIAEYDNEDHIAEPVLGNILVKLKIPKMARDVRRWLAQHDPDRIPAGWRT